MYVFIPRKLDFENNRELNDFPLNILLNKIKKEGNQITYGTALYEPDFSTFINFENIKQLSYKSIYDDRYSIVICFNIETGMYDGHKYCGDEQLGQACGNSWKSFFIHLGMLFLNNGERCSLETFPVAE